MYSESYERDLEVNNPRLLEQLVCESAGERSGAVGNLHPPVAPGPGMPGCAAA